MILRVQIFRHEQVAYVRFMYGLRIRQKPEEPEDLRLNPEELSDEAFSSVFV